MTDADALLPGAAAAWQVALSETSARILDIDVDVIRRERRPFQCDARFLPLLAWERSVHHWTGTDEAIDRARTDTSFEDHLSYGSPEALEKEISLDVSYEVKVRDFFEAGLEWPDFEVVIPLVADAAPPTANAIWKSALRRKNVRDMPNLRYQAPPARVVLGAALTVGGNIQILPEASE